MFTDVVVVDVVTYVDVAVAAFVDGSGVGIGACDGDGVTSDAPFVANVVVVAIVVAAASAIFNASITAMTNAYDACDA